MRRTAIQVHRGNICNNTTVVILVLFISIVTSLATVGMAWTMHRSVRQLAARWRSSSLFLLTNPAAGRTFGSFRGTFHRAFEQRTASTSTRLHSYQDFLREHPRDNLLVSYFTDIEGDKFYLDRYVDNSKVLTWIPNKHTKDRPLSMMHSSETDESSFPYDRRIDFCDSKSLLVFGGDLWDKGGFDLYVTRQLLDLKRRYPDRVVWVLGNRDINKLRMTQELGLPTLSASQTDVPYHPGLTWFRNSGRVGDPDGPLPSMDPGERLKWILGNTMGSPDAMEHRRRELLWERGGCQEAESRCINGQENNISDVEVVRSYQESCHPNGEMGRFLSEGLLAARVGPILFVHGSLPLTKETMAQAKENNQSIWDDLTFCMPWINKTHCEYGKDHEFATASDLGINSIEDWLAAVNKFCVQNVEAWKKHTLEMEQQKEEEEIMDKKFKEQLKQDSKEKIWAYRAGYGNGPSYSGTYYSDLVQYGMGMIPGGKKNPTVVYNSFTPEGMPTYFLPSEAGDDSHPSDVAICTREFFEQSPLQLILTGHKPQGDMPSPIKVDGSSWVICADTSYSGDTKWFHDARNSTDLETVEKRKQLEERQNLGRGKSISFRGETAVSEVLVELSEGAASLKSIRYHGVLSDGTEYESVNLVNDNENDDKETSMETSIGQVAPTSLVPDPSNSPHEGRWWTKGICRDGSRLYYAGEGYNVWNYIVSPDEVESDETRATN